MCVCIRTQIKTTTKREFKANHRVERKRERERMSERDSADTKVQSQILQFLYIVFMLVEFAISTIIFLILHLLHSATYLCDKNLFCSALLLYVCTKYNDLHFVFFFFMLFQCLFSLHIHITHVCMRIWRTEHIARSYIIGGSSSHAMKPVYCKPSEFRRAKCFDFFKRGRMATEKGIQKRAE